MGCGSSSSKNKSVEEPQPAPNNEKVDKKEPKDLKKGKKPEKKNDEPKDPSLKTGEVMYKFEENKLPSKGFLVLMNTGILHIYSDAKRKKSCGQLVLRDDAVESAGYLVDAEKAGKFRKSPDEVFIIFAGFREEGAAALEGRTVYVIPSDGRDGCRTWQGALSKFITFSSGHEAAASATTPGTHILVEPEFRKGGFIVPACFMFFGTNDDIRRLLELPSQHAQADLEVHLDYQRKTIIGRNPYKGWQSVPAVPTGQPGGDGSASWKAEAMLPAGKGYQSRWRARRAKKDDPNPVPNLMGVTVSQCKDLLAATKPGKLKKKSATSHPRVFVTHARNSAKTEVIKGSLAPRFDESFDFVLDSEPDAEPAAQRKLLEKQLDVPITFTVKSGRKFLGFAEVTPSKLPEKERGQPTWLKLTADPNSEDTDAKATGEIEVVVDWSFDETVDPSWRVLLTPFHRAPNIVEYLQPKVPVVAMMCSTIPRDKWSIRSLDPGDSAVRRRAKESLLGFEEFLPHNTWDVEAEVQSHPGVFLDNMYSTSTTEKATRAGLDVARDPSNQYKTRVAALTTPFLAMMKVLAMYNINLSAIFPDPLGLFIPKNKEFSDKQLGIMREKDPDREMATLVIEEELNLAFPEEEGGVDVTLLTFDQLKIAQQTKRPSLEPSFQLPIAVNYVVGKKEEAPKSIKFHYALACLRPPVQESPKRSAAANIAKAKGKLAGKKKGKEEVSTEDVELEDDEELDPEWVPTVEQVAEICRQSKFVEDVFVHRTTGPMPCTTAVVVPNATELVKWSEEARRGTPKAPYDMAARLAVLLDLIRLSENGVLSGNGVAIEGVGPLKVGAKDKEIIRPWDFVRAVHLEEKAWPKGTPNSDLATRYEGDSGVLATLQKESASETACINEGTWNAVELTPPKDGAIGWHAAIHARPGPIAFRWEIDSKLYFGRGRPVDDKVSRDDERTFALVHAVTRTPFGIGFNVGV